jgi:hypothetical protein
LCHLGLTSRNVRSISDLQNVFAKVGADVTTVTKQISDEVAKKISKEVSTKLMLDFL